MKDMTDEQLEKRCIALAVWIVPDSTEWPFSDPARNEKLYAGMREFQEIQEELDRRKSGTTDTINKS